MDKANQFREDTLKLPNVKSVIKTIDTPTEWEYKIDYKNPSTAKEKEEANKLIRKLFKEGTIKKIGDQQYMFDNGLWFDYTESM